VTTVIPAMVLALAAAAGQAAPGRAADAAPSAAEAEVRAAIVRAVRERVGDAAVTIDALHVRGSLGPGALSATPDAGSRAGGPMRFILQAAAPGRDAKRRGSADAIVRLRLVHARTTVALRPGMAITAADVAVVDADPGRVPLRPMPLPAALAGARVRRSLAAGETVPGDAVTLPPLVRSGDEVGTSVRVGAIVAQGRAIALEDGALGSEVRVLVDQRRLRGRVRGAGEVEITP
jgi:flagella basal body P-ring formation protein FlgA